MWPFTTPYPLKRLEDVADQTYDYIVVGGGTAGSVMASRLSEDPSTTVLVLERGPFNDSLISRIPLASVATGVYAVNRPCVPGVQTGNRKMDLMCAETLGGNSRINAMIYTRGAPAYYDIWAQKHPNWTWEKVEPYFRQVEKTLSLRQTKDLSSSIYPYLEKSASAIGLPIRKSCNAPEAPAMGYFNVDLTIDQKGYKHSAFHAYLPQELATQRQASLHICTDAIVSRLDLDASQSVVRGVMVHSAGKSKASVEPVVVKAKREVILTSGAICSPQLLQMSGLGPQSLLESLQIPVVRDLPGVGAHLADHALFPVFVEVPARETLQGLQDSVFQMLKHVFLFATTGQGWLKSVVDRLIFLNTAHFDDETGVLQAVDETLDGHVEKSLPNVEVMFIPVGTLPDTHPGKSLFTLQTIINQPVSEGSVKIQSSHPKEYPILQINMLSDERDREIARKALRFSLYLAEHFVYHTGFPHEKQVFGGPGGSEWKEGDWRSVSDAALDEYISKYVGSVFHLTSSCRMGSEDEGGVVDNELRVHGFKNLRIADASILPRITAGHPMAPVYMVAERCAEFVRASRS